MSANKTILDQPAKETYILPINAQNPIIYRHALYSTWISLSHIDCHVCFYVYMIIYDHPCKIIQIFLHVAIKVTTETHRCTPGVSIRGMQLSRWSWQTFVQSKPANCGCFQLFTVFFNANWIDVLIVCCFTCCVSTCLNSQGTRMTSRTQRFSHDTVHRVNVGHWVVGQ